METEEPEVIAEEFNGEVSVDEPEEAPAEEEVKEEAPEVEDPKAILESLKAENERIRLENEKTKKDLARAYYQKRKEKDKPKEDDPEFTDAQLLALIREHKDDEAVTLQIMKQVAKQQGKVHAIDAVKNQRIKSMRQNIDGFLSENFAQYVSEESPQHEELLKSKELMDLSDHPFGDFLAVSSIIASNFPTIVENVRKQAFDEALKKKGEETRKQSIKESAPATSKKQSGAAPVSEGESQWRATAKQMNMTESQTKRYLEMMRKIKK